MIICMICGLHKFFFSSFKWFERVSICVIILNCIALGLADPCDSGCRTQRCQILQTIEHGIFAFFLAEMLIKMLAMGVSGGSNSYLADRWNCFDCFIVIVGTVEYCFIEGDVNISVIRAFRVFRPLRAINRIPGLRLLVTLLLDILPMLGNVLVFCVFIFFIFGLIGVQIWSGTLRHRCFFPSNISGDFWPKSPEFMPPYYRTAAFDFACSPSSGMLTCDQIPLFEKNKESMCAELFEDRPDELEECQRWIPRYSDCRPDGPNPLQDTMSFDNIGYACIAIFQVISLEGWTEVMYLMQDASSFWVFIYFVALILIGSIFAVNLCLVVIAMQFSETKKREVANMRLERRGKATSLSKLSMVTSSSSEDVSVYNQVLDLITQTLLLIYRETAAALVRKQNATTKTHREKRRGIVDNKTPANKTWLGGLQAKNSKIRLLLRSAIEHTIGVSIVMGAILFNTIVMAAEFHNQPQTFTNACEIVNFILTLFFTVELLVKVYSYGPCDFIRDGFNMLDLIIVALNLAELQQGTGGSNLSALRTFRLVRVVKIIRFMPTLQRHIVVMLRTIDNIAPFFVLLSFFLYIFALLGMSLFGCRFCPQAHKVLPQLVKNETAEMIMKQCRLFVVESEREANETIMREIFQPPAVPLEDMIPCSRSNFDSLLSSLLTVLQVFTQDAWSAVLKDGMRHTSDFAAIYFVALVTIGNYVIFNLLVAILVEGFASENDPAGIADNDAAIVAFSRSVSQPKEAQLLIKHETNTVAKRTKMKMRKHLAPMITIQNYDDPCEEVRVVHPRRGSVFSLVPISEQTPFTTARTALSGAITQCRRIFQRRQNYSLYLLSPDNAFRKRLILLTGQPLFDNTVLAFILINCCLIALERPSIKSDGLERGFLDSANYFLNVVFAIEATIKILANGFLFGQNTYLSSPANVLDFVLVNCSTLHTVISVTSAFGSEGTKILEIFRVIRILRALRPLRVVNRAAGLRIALETLMVSIKPIGNVVIITISFFFVFAVLGLQLFRGCFYKCVAPEAVEPTNTSSTTITSFVQQQRKAPSSQNLRKPNNTNVELLRTIQNRKECLANGFSWENEGFNFDNLPNSLMSLFVFATFDGWVDISRHGVDCVGVDQQPIQDYNLWKMLYFIAFLLIVCFFILNMFVGVVVNNFQKVQKRVNAELEAKRAIIRREKLLARLARKGNIKKKNNFIAFFGGDDDTNKFAYACAVDAAGNKGAFYARFPAWRRAVHDAVTNRYFDLAIAVLTTATMITMALEFYRMPSALLLTMRIIGHLFTTLIALEVVVKCIAFGLWRYFRDRWNQLDFFVVISSFAGLIAEELVNFNPTLIQLIRIMRIARALKLLRTAQGITRLLHTVSKALPQVGNLSFLFLLLFFIYASVGVELFGKFDCNYIMCEGLSRHANFHHFGMSLLTLFRIFTGDNWNGILKDVQTFSSEAHCGTMLKIPEGQNGTSIECSIIQIFSPFYFVSFVLISQFILVNVVIAVLMGSLEGTRYFNSGVDEAQIGKEIAEKVDVLEDVVASVCPDLVGKLQAQLNTTREDVIRIVSTEYALRKPLATIDDENGPGVVETTAALSTSRAGSFSTTKSPSNGRRSPINSHISGQQTTTNISRESSIIAIDQNALADIFADLGSEMCRPANALQPVNAINWFVELRRSPAASLALVDKKNPRKCPLHQYQQRSSTALLVRSSSAKRFRNKHELSPATSLLVSPHENLACTASSPSVVMLKRANSDLSSSASSDVSRVEKPKNPDGDNVIRRSLSFTRPLRKGHQN